jgi:putative DNA primase/helicase
VTDKPPFHERVAARLVAQLEAGTAPWQRPWQPGSSYVPTNAATGKSYRGINALLLLSQDRSDPRWLTYKQAEALDAQVRKGEHGALIQYWKFQEQVPQRDAQGSILRDEAGQALHSSVELERPRVFYAVVFNADQIDGLPALETKSRDWEPIARAEALLAKSGAQIVHGGVRAFYSPARDLIRLPEQGQFETAASYYATALHELGHWTAHPTRLDRNIAHSFGSEEYAREELRAEIASLMLGDDIGVGHDPGQHAAYVGQWIAILKREPLEIFKAAAAAERIRDFVLGLERAQKLPASLQPTPDAPTQEAPMKAAPERSGQRVYIDVPYAEREAARDLGARWDRALRSWYVPEGQDPQRFSRWPSRSINVTATAEARTYLAVPYKERRAAQAVGAHWDPRARSWFVDASIPKEQIAQWLPERQPVEQLPGMDPREELATEMRRLGLVVSDEHPVMDGRPHRVPIEGDKRGEKGGFYVAHLDGRPAAYIKNHRLGLETTWKAKGYALSDEDKANLRAEAAQKLQERNEALEQRYEHTAQRLHKQLEQLDVPSAPTPYMVLKGIGVHVGVLADKNGTTVVPAIDVDGKVWSVAYISPEGRKRFAKASRKSGCFHVVGGLQRLRAASVICIAEGYATAATLAELAQRPVVAAFDAGNLESVAQALHAKFPDKPVLIVGDDDQAEQQRSGRNPGREHAERAAAAVGGRAIFPIFAPAEQKADPKSFSDFNDLTRSVLGRDGAARQFRHVYDTAATAAANRLERNEHPRARSLRAR